MPKNILVIGAGIGGLSTAYFLNKAGLEVTVIDKNLPENSASSGNAGFLSMFEKSPFAYPGVFRDTARAFLNNRTPMIINSYFSSDLLRWGARFYQSSKPKRYKRTLAVLEHFGEEVFKFYEMLSNVEKVDCEYHRNGFALIYTDINTYNKKLSTIPANSPHYDVLDKNRIREMFPFVLEDKIVGAVVLKRNGHLNPGRTLNGLRLLLESRGVKFVFNEEVTDFEFSNKKVVRAKSKNNSFEADQFVLASGANLNLAKKAGQNLVITPGRGYSISFKMDNSLMPKIPALFSDIYTAICPRRDDIRVTGKIEFGPSKSDPQERAESLVKVLKNYTKEFSIEDGKIWAGDRPLTGSDMPYLGRDPKYQNLSYITGLGHTGMNIGPVGARILSEVISKEQRNIENSDMLLLSEFYQA